MEATLTIRFPERVRQKIEQRGFSEQGLEAAVLHFVEALVQQPLAEAAPAARPALPDGGEFARRLIANNRELFDELARL